MAKTKKASAKPTNMSLDRDGGKFTLTWKNPVTYTSIKFKYRRKQNGTWQGWSSVETLSSPSSRKEKKFNIDLSIFFPTSGKPTLDAVEGFLSVQQKDTSKIEYTAATNSAVYTFKVPKDPTLSLTEGESSTSCSFSVAHTGAKETSQFRQMIYNVGIKDNWGTRSPKDFTGWGAQQSTANASGTISIPYGSTTASGTTSKTVMIRARSQGVNGNSPNWVYKSFVYAFPYSATNISASRSNRSTGCDVTVTWNIRQDDTHPVNDCKIQYCIDVPSNTSYAPPAGVRWEDGTDYLPKDTSVTTQRKQFYVDSRPSGEECLWVRVVQRNVLTNYTPSGAVVSTPNTITPVAPTISDITYNAATNALSASVTNNSELPNLTIYTQFVKATNGGGVVWTGSGTNPSGTVDLGSILYNVHCFATFGGHESNSYWTTFDPTLECTNPTKYYPTNVRASAGTTAGTVAVTWTNVMRSVEKAYIVVANSPSNFGDPEKTVEISGNNPTSGTVTGLQYNVQWYFKVYTENDAGESGLSTSMGSYLIPLDEVPAPNITLSATSNHDIVVSWSWNVNAEEIELVWDTDPKVGDSNNVGDATGDITIQRNNRVGADSYTIKELEWNRTWYVWARFGKDDIWTKRALKQYTLTVVIPYPNNLRISRAPQPTDEAGKTTLFVSWECNSNDATEYEIEWSDNYYAKVGSSDTNKTTVSSNMHYVYISDVDLGKKWYFWATTIAGQYRSLTFVTPTTVDLRTTPSKPVITLSSNDVYLYSRIDASWNYSCEDLAEQKSASLTIRDSQSNVVATLTAGEEQYMAIYPNELGLAPNADYSITMRTVSKNDIQSEASAPVSFHVSSKPTATITSTSLVTRQIGEDPEDLREVTALADLPLSVTVGGIQNNGYATVYIERSKTIKLDKPDGNKEHGYEGELIALKRCNPDGTVEFTMNDLRTPFEDMGEYRIVATVTDKYGVSDPAELEFMCLWDWQAITPSGTLVMDYNNYIAKITVDEIEYEQEGDGEGDWIDIYRLSADAPELIVHQAVMGETYVDPYPALGENVGYRLVYVTANGDYTTEDGMLAWTDLEPEEPLKNDRALIDFDDNRVECYYNVDFSNSWSKDFTETKYLGGSVQGDWNPAVSRTGSIGTVMITLIDASSIEAMKRLAVWAGACHVRTPDGSSFSADVQVNNEGYTHSTGRVIATCSLSITRVDPDGFEGMTLEEYQNGVE